MSGAGKQKTSAIPQRGWVMAKYLVKATYSQEGLKGVIKGGGSARRAALTQSAQSVGQT